MDLLKALGGINAANNADTARTYAPDPAATEKEKNAPAPDSAPDNTPPVFNPMADILARHENAVNRLKRGK